MENIIKNNNSFVVVDIETTGFYGPAKGGRILEIGALKIVDGKGVAKFSQLINPKRFIPPKVIALTGIQPYMLQDKPECYPVLKQFYKFIDGSAIVAHNISFDWNRFLLVFFNQMGLSPQNELIDTLKLSKKYLKNDDKKYNLGYLCEMLDIKLEDSHRAYDDALATAYLFMHLKKEFIDNK